MHPMPPASLTAAAKRLLATPPIPAHMIGNLIPSKDVREVGKGSSTPPLGWRSSPGLAAAIRWLGEPRIATASWEKVPPFA